MEKVKMVKFRQIYTSIEYGGVTDDYLFHFNQPCPRHKNLRMFTGDRYKHTLSEQTLLRLEREQGDLEDRIGEVYLG